MHIVGEEGPAKTGRYKDSIRRSRLKFLALLLPHEE